MTFGLIVAAIILYGKYASANVAEAVVHVPSNIRENEDYSDMQGLEDQYSPEKDRKLRRDDSYGGISFDKSSTMKKMNNVDLTTNALYSVGDNMNEIERVSIPGSPDQALKKKKTSRKRVPKEPTV